MKRKSAKTKPVCFVLSVDRFPRSLCSGKFIITRASSLFIIPSSLFLERGASRKSNEKETRAESQTPLAPVELVKCQRSREYNKKKDEQIVVEVGQGGIPGESLSDLRELIVPLEFEKPAQPKLQPFSKQYSKVFERQK